MNTIDFHQHFREKARQFGYLCPEHETVDGVKIGSGGADITKMAVSWKATMNNLVQAHEAGCDFFISHESLFCNGRNGREDTDDVVTSYEYDKLEWLRETGMTVYRLHDGWDAYPKFGVLDSWQNGLGFADVKILKQNRYIRLLEIPTIPFNGLASSILDKIKPLGQNTIQISPARKESVRRLVITAGAAGTTLEMLEMQPDAVIRSDDWFNWVREGELVAESGVGLIIVNHGTCEEWGMQNLHQYLKQSFPDIKTIFLPGGCEYKSLVK
jgi:putative NIF3 family GTP cyclohydrolase 1 type 2